MSQNPKTSCWNCQESVVIFMDDDRQKRYCKRFDLYCGFAPDHVKGCTDSRPIIVLKEEDDE